MEVDDVPSSITVKSQKNENETMTGLTDFMI